MHRGDGTSQRLAPTRRRQPGHTDRRGGVRDAAKNNAKFGFNTDVVRVDVAEVRRGQPVLINYKWTNTRWDEIESRVVGLCAWEARAGEQGLGPEGGAYVEQLVVALRRGGIGAMMLRAVRRHCGATDGRVELQVHDKNKSRTRKPGGTTRGWA